MTAKTQLIPQAFIWRKLHSLLGVWLVIFIIEHLFVNSQAALDQQGFIRSANGLENIPYLKAVELLFLGLPIFIHGAWGIKYLLTAKYNSFGNDGKSPYLPEYPRNHAYTWQRITSWILVVGILAHVIHMRFIEHPMQTEQGAQNYYMVKVQHDQDLHSLSERLNVRLLNAANLKDANLSLPSDFQLLPDQHLAVADNFGAVELLMVRETFKMPIMIVLYTLFVLTACYHAFNGLWTAMISWGVTLTQKSQKLMLKISTALMILVSLLGLSAIWLT